MMMKMIISQQFLIARDTEAWRAGLTALDMISLLLKDDKLWGRRVTLGAQLSVTSDWLKSTASGLTRRAHEGNFSAVIMAIKEYKRKKKWKFEVWPCKGKRKGQR
jgi:hypothetical protein